QRQIPEIGFCIQVMNIPIRGQNKVNELSSSTGPEFSRALNKIHTYQFPANTTCGIEAGKFRPLRLP
ncbi:MAG: hypothetical protein JWM99_1205, partial [Verrucomicrobiales bacterium]|nr:hypothetical protein [Verrucomicrobiales bacterium]